MDDAEMLRWMLMVDPKTRRIPPGLRALADALIAREREKCARLCEDAKASIWELHDPAVKQAAANVCDNLAARIRGA